MRKLFIWLAAALALSFPQTIYAATGAAFIAKPSSLTVSVTASGTTTVPAWATKADFTLVGGGGGGGGGGNSTGGGGGGGGGGATQYTYGVPVTPSSTLTVTIGAGGAAGAVTADGVAGGTTTVTGAANNAQIIYAVGGALGKQGGGAGGAGAGGAGGSPTVAALGVAGLEGGTSGSGTDTVTCYNGTAYSNTTARGGFGGCSLFGASTTPSSDSAAGIAGLNYGAGGGGGGSTGNVSGGAGAPGIVIITYYP